MTQHFFLSLYSDSAKDEAEEEKDPEEFVLHSKQLQPLSLAEKYGFVPAPANPNLSGGHFNGNL